MRRGEFKYVLERVGWKAVVLGHGRAFHARWLELYKENRHGFACHDHRKWKAWEEASHEFPGVWEVWEESRKIWRERRKRGKKANKKWREVSHYKQGIWRLRQSRRQATGRAIREHAAATLQVRRVEEQARKDKLVEKHRERKIEIQDEKAREEAMDRERLRRQQQQIAQAILGPIRVDDQETDIARDILWVYEHLHELFRLDSVGARELVPEVLEKAPSNGAIAFSNYALLDFREFFNKFVIKILPRDLNKRDEEEKEREEDEEEDLDPKLGDIDKYLK